MDSGVFDTTTRRDHAVHPRTRVALLFCVPCAVSVQRKQNTKTRVSHAMELHLNDRAIRHMETAATIEPYYHRSDILHFGMSA